MCPAMPPAATATMLLAEEGTLVWLLLLKPQATTEPSGRSARTWEPLTAPLFPPESMQTFVAASGTRVLLPHAATFPRARMAFELVAKP